MFELMDDEVDVLSAPCVFCDYNGSGYWQAGTHSFGCPWTQIGGQEERRERLRRVIRVMSKRASMRLRSPSTTTASKGKE